MGSQILNDSKSRQHPGLITNSKNQSESHGTGTNSNDILSDRAKFFINSQIGYTDYYKQSAPDLSLISKKPGIPSLDVSQKNIEQHTANAPNMKQNTSKSKSGRQSQREQEII